MRRLLVFFVLLAACSRRAEVPVNTLLWRVQDWKPVGAGVRRAPARFISFRASGEYVEHVCYVLEHADSSVYLSRSDPHVVTIGTWTASPRQIGVNRRIVFRSSPRQGGRDPLCSDLVFTVSGLSVLSSDGQYSPVTRFVAPDFETYVNDARRSGTPCPQS